MPYLRPAQNALLKALLFLYRLFISLKLAVFILLALAVLTAVGTFIESQYNQEIANKLVYRSLWMTATLLLLAVNLISVLIDRWPWRKRHFPFVLAHIGILTLMLGSLVTRSFGVDGSLRFKEGEKASLVSVSDMEIKIYSSYDGENFSLIHEEPVDMFFIRPTLKKPYVISTAHERFIIKRHFPFAIGRELFQPVSKNGRPAVRFYLAGSQANMAEWIYLDTGENVASRKFGPAVISLTKDINYKAQTDKELVLLVEGGGLFYSLSGKKKQPLKRGSVFSTGWMDFQFRLLEFFPQAQKAFVFEPKDKPSDSAVKAIHVQLNGHSAWMGQNSYVRFFKEDRVYAMAYLNKTYRLDFDLELLDFKMTAYPGSSKAKSYESEVRLKGQTKIISMNEPLQYGGWTFYQSSFEPPQAKEGAFASILSVNRDPGRPVKYFGSFLIVIGAALLFYRRKIGPPRL